MWEWNLISLQQTLFLAYVFKYICIFIKYLYLKILNIDQFCDWVKNQKMLYVKTSLEQEMYLTQIWNLKRQTTKSLWYDQCLEVLGTTAFETLKIDFLNYTKKSLSVTIIPKNENTKMKKYTPSHSCSLYFKKVSLASMQILF